MNFLIRIGLVLTLGFNLGFCEELIVASCPVIEAYLYIDGKLAGETPLNLKVLPGKYKLKAEKEGWFGEEKEVVVGKGEEYVFVNVFMRREEKISDIKSQESRGEEQESEIRALEYQGTEASEVSKIEPPKIELEKPKEGPPKIVEPPKIEPQKIEPQNPKKEEIQKLILKASSLIEEVEEEGVGRFAKERLKKAKELLKKAKKENSFELATLSISETELALKETKEKISHYNSGYITGIFKNIGK